MRSERKCNILLERHVVELVELVAFRANTITTKVVFEVQFFASVAFKVTLYAPGSAFSLVVIVIFRDGWLETAGFKATSTVVGGVGETTADMGVCVPLTNTEVVTESLT